ncbi:nucleotide exchange factor GrpE [Saccharothrix obliqua]|uniref:nucleotide exchange factor GrpE n=1 Tax=Saccharothrix obliqua TaxID=2861747 RepID=UPI001C5EAB69|nr:hypothetical protein [Saccharothrix obliqua]MBW4721075.1 hypothetical protein [Saccharothrix obliqua]
MSRNATALIALGALGAFLGLAVVLTPGEPTVDTRAVAEEAVVAARRAPAPDVIADGVARVLPPGGRAVVVRPARGNEPSSRGGTDRVAVVVGDVDRAAVSLLVSAGGAVGVGASPDGWWAAVAVPAEARPPVGAALGLLVGAVLLGAAANEAPRRGARADVLVRGLTDLVPRLPAELAGRVEDALAAAGVRPVVPDGRPVDPVRHRVVGVEPTDDAELVGTVARTVRPGYAEGGRLLVPPLVVRYVLLTGIDHSG